MNEIQKKIDTAHRMISIISVSGDAVDVIAAARATLKEAFALAGEVSGLQDTCKTAGEKEEAEHG